MEPGGRVAAVRFGEERNVRAPPDRVPGNTRAGRPDGKCHRNIPSFLGRIRVKWCGKSAPASPVTGAWGKPHPEQGQIGGQSFPQGRGGSVRLRPRVGRLSPAATSGLERWPPVLLRKDAQNSAYRPPGSTQNLGTTEPGNRAEPGNATRRGSEALRFRGSAPNGAVPRLSRLPGWAGGKNYSCVALRGCARARLFPRGTMIRSQGAGWPLSFFGRREERPSSTGQGAG